MSDRSNRNAGRRRDTLLSSAPARPGAGAEKPERPATSLLGEALGRERARHGHREAAAVRKALANPQVLAKPQSDAGHLFKDWDEPPPPAAPPRAPAPPPAVESALRSPANDPGAGPARDDEVWRPLIDPMALIGGVLRSRGIIATTTALGALAGVAFALSTPKAYMAFAELLVDPRNLQIVDRDLTGNGYMATEATLSLIENQVRIMRSGPVLSKVAEKLHLDADPEFNGAGKSFGLSSLLATLRGLLSSSDGPTAGEARMALTIDKLARAIDIERAGKTFIVEISAESRDAAKSALIANALVDTYLEKAASFQSENAGRATGELSGRLEEMRKAVEASERKVEDYKAENDLVDAKGVLIGDDELVRLNDQLTVARAKTLELNARAASARELDAEAVISGNLPEQVSNVSLSQLRSQYATLAQEVAKSAVRLGPRHPQRQAAEAQLADARASIERELRRVTASIQIEMKRAVQFEQELSSRLSQIKSRQAMVSDKLVQLREIERDSAAKRAVYESYLLRARETGEQQGVNTGNISVVSRATPSLEPTGPSRALIAILGTILGFAAGVAIGMARGIWSSLKSGGSPSGGARPAVAPARNAQLDPNPTRREMPISTAGLAASAEPPALAPAILPAASNPPRAEQPQMPASPYAAPVPAQSPSTVYPEPQPPVWPPAPWGPAFTPQPQMAPSPYAALVTAPSPYAVYPQPQPPVWPQAPWLTPSAPQPMFFAPQPAVMPPMMMPYAPQPVWPSHPQGQQVAPPPSVPQPTAPVAPPVAAAADDDERIDGLRRGLARFRETVEDLAAARQRRRG